MTDSKDPGLETESSRASFGWFKLIALAAILGFIALVYWKYRDNLSLTYFAQKETELLEFRSEHPVFVYGAAFLVYVVVTGLSLPGATIMTLFIGWFFGLWRGVVLVSFASTTGATLAFLLSRYFLRDSLQKKFGNRLRSFNEALDREGAFYLFTLRLIPAVPFFVINVVMGLTRIRVWTFWWVSQVGMFAGTIVYTYAGSRVPDLQQLAEHGAQAVFQPKQLASITFAFVLLGVFPLAIKKIMAFVRPRTGPPAADDQDASRHDSKSQ